MTEELKDKELTDIKYLRARMTGNVGLALDHAYNLGFFDGKKNVAEKIRTEILKLDDINPDYPMDRTIHISRNEVLQIIDKYLGE